MNRSVTWVVKASKLCNLRCSYCYEWDELSLRDRMSFSQWEKLFLEMKRYAEFLRKPGEVIDVRVVLHGGEPLVLPVAYLKSVVDLQQSILLGDPDGNIKSSLSVTFPPPN